MTGESGPTGPAGTTGEVIPAASGCVHALTEGFDGSAVWAVAVRSTNCAGVSGELIPISSAFATTASMLPASAEVAQLSKSLNRSESTCRTLFDP